MALDVRKHFPSFRLGDEQPTAREHEPGSRLSCMSPNEARDNISHGVGLLDVSCSDCGILQSVLHASGLNLRGPISTFKGVKTIGDNDDSVVSRSTSLK